MMDLDDLIEITNKRHPPSGKISADMIAQGYGYESFEDFLSRIKAPIIWEPEIQSLKST